MPQRKKAGGIQGTGQWFLAAACVWALAAYSSIPSARAGELFSKSRSATASAGTVATVADGLYMTIPAERTEERIYWDIPITHPADSDSSLGILISCDNPAIIRAVTVHLQSGGHWLSATAPTPDGTGRQLLIIPRSDFTAESGNPAWKNADTFRLSAWLFPGSQAAGGIGLYSIQSLTPSAAILADPGTFPEGEAYVAGQCVQKALHLFNKAGVPATVVADPLERLNLSAYRLLILPYNPSLTDGHLDHIRRFVEKQNGLVVFFYNGNAKLGNMLDIEIMPYVSQQTDWTAIGFSDDERAEFPILAPVFTHITRHLLPVRGRGSKTKTLGRWLTARDVPDRALPASAVSSKGIAFSHIPPLATPAAVRWLLAALSIARPDTYGPLASAHLQEQNDRDKRARDLLLQTKAPAGEMRAIWSLPIAQPVRAQRLGQLRKYGLTVLFEETPMTATTPRQRKAIEATLEAGLKPHAWVYLLNAENLSIPSARLMQNAQGNTIPWLCPLNPENRTALRNRLLELAESGISGLHLDYVRYPARDACYCPRHRSAIEKKVRKKLSPWPQEVLPGGPHAAAFHELCKDDLSLLIGDLTSALRKAHPDLTLSAAVYPTPGAALDNAQDWPAWLERGYFDFVAPMTYASSAGIFAAYLEQGFESGADPAKILAGIGISADETQLDKLGVAEQIVVTRQKQTKGYSLFQLTPETFQQLP